MLRIGVTLQDKRPRSRGTNCPSFASAIALEIKRAQGMPDAGRTREPCVQRKVHFAHASNNRAAKSTGIPCAMVYGLYVVSLVYRAC